MTLIEVIVAATVLIVGILSTFSLVDAAQRTTQENARRTAASNLAREILEQARSLDYFQLTPATMAAALRTRPSLAGAIAADGSWVIVRRRYRVTVTPTVCTFDDPMDGLASTPPENPCPSAAAVAGAPTESNPDDFRRVGLTMTWQSARATSTTTHAGLVANPSGGQGPLVTSFPDPFTIQVTAGVNVPFVATTTAAATVRWSMDDGIHAGDAHGGPSVWGFNWDIGTVGVGTWTVDGTYSANVQPFDARGVPGQMRVATVLLNRRVPLAPAGLVGGRSDFSGGVVELEWKKNRERDVLGYRVYRTGSDSMKSRVCPPASAGAEAVVRSTACTDLAPGPTPLYSLVAVDRPVLGDAASGTREGDTSTMLVGPIGLRPTAPLALQATKVDGRASLTWVGPAAGVLFYRIYRDGVRLDRTVGADPVWIDPEILSGARTYAVSAVGLTFNESALSTAVTVQ